MRWAGSASSTRRTRQQAIAILAVALVAWVAGRALTDEPVKAPPTQALRPVNVPVPAPPPGSAPQTGSHPLPEGRTPAPFTAIDRRRRPPIANGPFYVQTLDPGALSYGVARYANGFPDPPGVVAGVFVDTSRPCPGLTSPSVTRDREGTYYMYVIERLCDEVGFRRIVVLTSFDGKRFTRRGTVLEATSLTSPYVVYDDGLFRAWYNREGGLFYAESRDGFHFHQRGPRKSQAVKIDQVMKIGSRWYMFNAKTRIDQVTNTSTPALITFADPRQPRYPPSVKIGERTQISGRLAAPAEEGDMQVTLEADPAWEVGDAVVGRSSVSDTGDVLQIESVQGRTLRFNRPLGRSYKAGDSFRSATRTSLAPSYVCREADGTWAGIFSAYGAFPKFIHEITLVYRAPSIRGPWHVDRQAPAPLMTLENGEMKRSAFAPRIATRSPSPPRCE